MAQQKSKHIKSSNKIAQIMYSIFSLEEIYHAAAFEMGMDVRCKSKTGIPQELTEEEYDRRVRNLPEPDKARIKKFQKECSKFLSTYLKEHGVYYKEREGMTETERYASLRFGSIWYREIG